MQAKPTVGPQIRETVVAAMSQVDDDVAFQSEFDALCRYIEHMCITPQVPGWWIPHKSGWQPWKLHGLI